MRRVRTSLLIAVAAAIVAAPAGAAQLTEISSDITGGSIQISSGFFTVWEAGTMLTIRPATGYLTTPCHDVSCGQLEVSWAVAGTNFTNPHITPL